LTLYVRNPDKLPADLSGNANVTVVKGTLEDEAGLHKVTASGATVFVSFAGPVSTSKGTVRLFLSFIFSIPLHQYICIWKYINHSSLSPMP
jgi:hypothetical protein